EELDDVNRNLGSLENLLKLKKQLTEEKADYLRELQERKKAIQEELATSSNETEELNSYLQELSVSGKISASAQVYAGTKVYIKDAYLEVRNEFKAVTFVSDANTVKVTKYEESEEDISIQRS
ncbi:MAG: FapA family protein, partial [Firmicutes bacterium]|nr:FapA family protein [Bacillota bacterium]